MRCPHRKLRTFASDRELCRAARPVELKLATLWEEDAGHSSHRRKDQLFRSRRTLTAGGPAVHQNFARLRQDLPLATLFRAPTIEQLAQELRGASSKPAYSSLVTIQPLGSKPPFFCVHGGAGSTLFLHRLSREMGFDQPFYGLGAGRPRWTTCAVAPQSSRWRHTIYRKSAKCNPPVLIFSEATASAVWSLLKWRSSSDEQGEQAALVAMFSAPLRFHRLVPSQLRAPMPKEFQAWQATVSARFCAHRQALRWRYRLPGANRALRASHGDLRAISDARASDSAVAANYVRGAHDQRRRNQCAASRIREP